jgi:uncharacterized protein YkwD
MNRLRILSVSLTLAAAVAFGLLPTVSQAGAAHQGRTAHAVSPTRRHSVKAGQTGAQSTKPGITVQMFRATNASRCRNGMRRFSLNWKLSLIARQHAMAMAKQHRLFHTSRVGRYLNGVGRWSSWGENIGWTTGAVGLLEQAFMASAIHREHILSHVFHHVAVGAVQVGNKLWVSLFFYG